MPGQRKDIAEVLDKSGLFIPRWDVFLKKIHDCPMDSLLLDPHLLCNTLFKLQQLFQLKALCLNITPGVIAHDLGWTGSWQGDEYIASACFPLDNLELYDLLMNGKILKSCCEALKHVRKILPPDAFLVASIPGVSAMKIYEEQYSPQGTVNTISDYFPICKHLIRMYGDLDIFDAVIIDDGGMVDKYFNMIDQSDFWRKYASMWNLLSHYNLTMLHIVSEFCYRNLPDKPTMSTKKIFFIVPGAVLESSTKTEFPEVTGIALDNEAFRSDRQDLTMIFKNFSQKLNILTSLSSIPLDANMESLHRMNGCIGINLSQ